MFIRYIETFFYIIISQTDSLIYFFMLMSMYQNAGIISLFYPIAVLGYALLEETRPSYNFWRIVGSYTICILLFKFIMNISIWESFLSNPTVKFYISLIKLGIFDYSSFVSLFFYMIPEICIICFIMLNEVKLKLLGVYWANENQIETIHEGIQRNLCLGNEEEI